MDSTGRPYDPWLDLAQRTDLTLGEIDLPNGISGMWFPDIRGIAIDERATRAQKRCALAHHLIHAEYDHGRCAGGGPGVDRIPLVQERWATAQAAARLISIGALVSVLAEVLPARDAAAQLGVTEHYLHVRLKHLRPHERAWVCAVWGRSNTGLWRATARD